MGNLFIVVGAVYAAAVMFQVWSYTSAVNKATEKVEQEVLNADLVPEEASCY